jgi:hypothetical protein
MAPPPLRLPSVSKVVGVFSALWIFGCAAMFWSMRHSSRALILFFLILAGVPIAAMWALVMVAHRLEKRTAPRGPRRGTVATNRDKKRLIRRS